MLLINHLTDPGCIKRVLLSPTEITVTTIDNQVMTYRRDNANHETDKTLQHLQAQDILAERQGIRKS